MKKIGWSSIPMVFFALLSFFLWQALSLNPQELPSAQLGKPLTEFILPRLDNPHSFLNSKQIRDQVVLLNVWASWCTACIDEQVFLLQLAREGVLIYGLNYKDRAEDALHWLEQWGNPYQVVVQDREGRVAIDLGVYGTPETFVVDKQGIIRYRHAGIMTQKIWKKEVNPLIKQLQAAT